MTTQYSPSLPQDNKKATCKVWFCTRIAAGGDGFCTKHQRQFTRTDNPLAGEDAKALNKIAVRSIRIIRGLMNAAVWVDQNDIAHCRVCDSHSAPHGKINHKDGCAVVAAKELLVGYDKV